MILSLKTPSVLRVLVTFSQWKAEENDICSLVMGESVTNLQFLAVLMVAVGIILTLCVAVYPLVGMAGLALMYCGSVELQGKEDGVC